MQHTSLKNYRSFLLKRAGIQFPTKTMAILFAIFVLFLGILTAANYAEILFSKDTHDRLETELNRLQHQVPEQDRGIIGIIKPDLLNDKAGFYPILAFLSSFPQHGLWLTHMQMDLVTSQVTIEGKALTPSDVHLFINKLTSNGSPLLNWNFELAKLSSLNNTTASPVTNQNKKNAVPALINIDNNYQFTLTAKQYFTPMQGNNTASPNQRGNP